MAGKKKGGQGTTEDKSQPTSTKKEEVKKKTDNPPAKKAVAAAVPPNVQNKADADNKPQSVLHNAPPVAIPVESAVSAPVQGPVGGKAEKKIKDKPKEPKKERESGKGLVKAVLSGDKILVLNLTKKTNKGPPEEKTISLSLVNAPPLGRRNPETKEMIPEKPWAWESREYLRKLLIGQVVAFTIEGKLPNKEYGLVWVDTDKGRENVGKLVVSNGWAEVRKPTANADVWPEWEELLRCEEKAQQEGKGMFKGKDEKTLNKHTRKVTEINNPTDYLEKFKAAPQTGVVEQVRTGSTLKVLLLPQFYEITLILSGVDCPATRANESEPFGREAKFFTEHKILNRDIQIIFEGADRYNFYGTVNCDGSNVSEELLLEGLARYVDWSGMRTAFTERLKAAQKQAQAKNIRLWKDFEAPKPLSRQEEKKQARPGKEILGTVIEIVNAGCVTVLDNNKNEHKLYLSSVKVPRQGNPTSNPNEESKKEQQERAQAFEAKEYLRRRLISQRVRCVIDYVRAPSSPKPTKQNKAKNNEERTYASIYIDKNNVAVELVEHGLATAQEHRGGEQRSKDFEDILYAESRAKKAGKGQSERVSVTQVVDTTKDIKEAQRKAPYLLRGGRMRGVVEYEFNASRLKILAPKENCQIILSLSGIQTPKKGEKYFKEAELFTKERVHQRDVDFEVVAQDGKGSGFIGDVFIGKESLAVLLLQEGFAKIFRASDRTPEAVTAEDAAKRKKKHLWENYDEAKEREQQEKRRAENEERRHTVDYLDVIVTEITDGCHFWVQTVGKQTEDLEELMSQLAVEESEQPYTPKVRELVKAKFTQDDTWYRAVVTGRKDAEFTVLYSDYGNSETIPTSRIRPLPEKFRELPAQATQAQLAYIKTPRLEEEYGVEAAEFLKELVWGKTMIANVEYKEQGVMFLSLGDRESQVHVNAALLRAGLARVQQKRGDRYAEMLSKLREEETKAKQNHVCVWEYGDPGSDEDDDGKRGGKPSPAAAKKV